MHPELFRSKCRLFSLFEALTVLACSVAHEKGQREKKQIKKRREKLIAAQVRVDWRAAELQRQSEQTGRRI